MQAILIFLIIFIIIDLLFYIPIHVQVLIADDLVGIYIFSIPIFLVTEKKIVNLLKNKISIQKLKYADKEDVKYIESIRIEEIRLNYTFLEHMPMALHYIYPCLGILKSFNKSLLKNKIQFSCDKKKKYYLYAKVSLKIARVVKYYFIIRRIKHERTSN